MGLYWFLGRRKRLRPRWVCFCYRLTVGTDHRLIFHILKRLLSCHFFLLYFQIPSPTRSPNIPKSEVNPRLPTVPTPSLTLSGLNNHAPFWNLQNVQFCRILIIEASFGSTNLCDIFVGLGTLGQGVTAHNYPHGCHTFGIEYNFARKPDSCRPHSEYHVPIVHSGSE